MASTHDFPADRVHYPWDEANEPVLTIDERRHVVIVDTRDVSDDQITPESDARVLATLDWDRVYPLAGPIRVEGAAARRHAGRRDRSTSTRRAGAGPAIIPGFGLLPDDFPEPYLRIFDLTRRRRRR